MRLAVATLALLLGGQAVGEETTHPLTMSTAPRLDPPRLLLRPVEQCGPQQQECQRGAVYWCCPRSQQCNYGGPGRSFGGCIGPSNTREPPRMPAPR